MQEEATGADGEAVPSYPEDLAVIINEGGYTIQQISSVDVTAFWVPASTFIAREEKSVPAFKASRDRLTLVRDSCSW